MRLWIFVLGYRCHSVAVKISVLYFPMSNQPLKKLYLLLFVFLSVVLNTDVVNLTGVANHISKLRGKITTLKAKLTEIVTDE